MTEEIRALRRLPDFIIGGAPKCGTTSLHFILGQNPQIGIPDNEIHYFDADDPITHPDFLDVRGGDLKWFDVGLNNEESLDWYASRFSEFGGKLLVGEDSTTYLFSAVAARRIKSLLPDVRLIFLLRDPVKRAYSQYWHLIRSARLSCSFEQALSRHSSIILGSTYAPHVADYFNVFGRENVHVAVFEDFLSDKQAFINRITNHIGASEMDAGTLKTWFNRTYYPTMPGCQQWLNRIGGRIVAGRYRNHMEHETRLTEKIRHKLHYHWFRRVNPVLLKAEKPPAMQPGTAAYLAHHLSDRNAGLSDLLNRDLSAIWPGFRG
ncbi:sulfotransferase [Leisingera sp. HS039]|uniref:sulfotransferase family protein n=1 Tax=Leisingera sp. HS039 TaxID=2818496 RepID=UPI001B3A658F|nr:sulfotransferase [Leisingera sp. HS039]MBQ4824492.1 sulfotransferase [Leisingera sp. HS039]